MTNSEWQLVHGTLMTSEPIAAYGGISIPTATLQDIALQMSALETPFHLDHDLSKPLRMRNLEFFVKRRSDGIDELRFQAELHEKDIHWLESRPAVSGTLMSPLERDQAKSVNSAAEFRLSADHAWFSDDSLIRAEEQFLLSSLELGQIAVERAYQFSAVPDPQIYLQITYSILSSIGAAALWDGIKVVFAKRKTPHGGSEAAPTVINLTVKDGPRSMTAVVKTQDESVAHRAIDAISETATDFFQGSADSSAANEARAVTVWDHETGRWTIPG